MTKGEILAGAAKLKSIPDIPISGSIDDIEYLLGELKSDHADLIVHEFMLFGRIRAFVAFTEGLIDDDQCSAFILRPLTRKRSGNVSDVPFIVQSSQVKRESLLSTIIYALFNGNVAIFADGDNEATLVEIRSSFGRSVSEPDVDRSILGAREGFVEKIVVNLAILRRKLRDPRLSIINVSVGRRGQARVSIAYIADIADDALVSNVTERLRAIDVDAVLNAGQLSQYLDDGASSPFPKIIAAERADITAEALLEGRVAVFMDQIPKALIVPTFFIDLFKAADDNGEKPYAGTAKRMLRVFAFFLGALLPALYTALMTFHTELLPPKLAIPLLNYRSMTLTGVMLEMLIVELLIALIAEAAMRTPEQISQTVGLVGGVIIGQALISSRLASPPTLVIATFAIIAQYALPGYSLTRPMSLIRIAGIVLAGISGLFGVAVLFSLVVISLTQTQCCGLPYAAPIGTPMSVFAALRSRSEKNSITRSGFMPAKDTRRQS